MRITSQTTSVAVMLLGLGALLLVMAAGMPYGAAQDGPVPAVVWALSAFMALIGVPLSYYAGRQIADRVRYGAWQIECPDGGGRLGQPLEVALVAPRPVTPTGELECTLVCFHTTGVSNNRGPNKGRASSRVHNHAWTVRTGPLDPHAGARLVLELPEAGFPSKRDRQSTVEWKLSVAVPSAGRTHRMEFELPVRAGAGSSQPKPAQD